MIIPSDNRLVLVVSEREKYMPLGRIARAVKSPPEKLRLNPTMRELISKVDRQKAAWGVAKVTSIFRGEFPPLAPYDWIVGEIDQDESGALSARFAGYGPDAKAISASVLMANGFMKVFIPQVEKYSETSPIAKQVVQGLKSIRLTSKDNLAKLTLSTDNAGTAVFSPLILEHASRASRRADRPRAVGGDAKAVDRVKGGDDRPAAARARATDEAVRRIIEAKRAEAEARAARLRRSEDLRKAEKGRDKADHAAKHDGPPKSGDAPK